LVKNVSGLRYTTKKICGCNTSSSWVILQKKTFTDKTSLVRDILRKNTKYLVKNVSSLRYTAKNYTDNEMSTIRDILQKTIDFLFMAI